MNDNNTMAPAIVLAAGVATAGSLAYYKPAGYESRIVKFDSLIRRIEKQNNKTHNKTLVRENLGCYENTPCLKD